MRLNKNAYYTLLNILNGHDTAAKISEQLPTIDIRSVQRALIRLAAAGLIVRKGTNNPLYSINYSGLLIADIDQKYLEDPKRPKTRLNHEFLRWLETNAGGELDSIITNLYPVKTPTTKPVITPKELEYLTIELSWKSSALEGNTYTLIDTQLLLVDGIKAQHKTDFETQMILNHKDAVSFIIANGELFKKNIKFSSLEELHKIISFNLGIARGIRKKIVRVSASNYEPLANPHQLRQAIEDVLNVINKVSNPVVKALIALSAVPYLQSFEDGNKRLGRLLANAILIQSIGRGFSLRKVEAKDLALAYIEFYEFNSLNSLAKILLAELTD